MKKSRFFLVIISMVLILSSASEAKAGTRTITISRGSVNIVIEDNLIEPKDVNGHIVEPFVYEGTTYLPVRAVAEAFGLTVEWHESLYLISLEKYFSEQANTGSSDGDSVYPGINDPQIVKNESFLEEITVSTDNIFLMLNDEEVDLKDVNGNRVDILLSGGTNYLPVRAIANALKMDVLWEEATGTVYLNNTAASSSSSEESNISEDE